MNKLIFHLILALLLGGSISINAQVTIGSGIAPSRGALLDLKEKGVTKKGLGMPRVKLSDVKKLYPMYTAGYDVEEDAKHTGLMVYHVLGEAKPQCERIPDGMYVWNGSEWLGMGVKKIDTPTAKWEIIHSVVEVNSTVVFTVKVDFPDNIKYVWSVTGGATNGEIIAGQGSSTVTVKFTTVNPTVGLQCVVSNDCGEARKSANSFDRCSGRLYRCRDHKYKQS